MSGKAACFSNTNEDLPTRQLRYASSVQIAANKKIGNNIAMDRVSIAIVRKNEVASA